MTERATQLRAVADGQIAELITFLSTVDEATLRLPCPGRDKLGDGTVGASARHTADNYQRIAAFVQGSDGPAGPGHDGSYAAGDIDLAALTSRLSASRDVLGHIAQLTASQLDAIPPKDSFRFCDGQRTLEQVLAGLLKHQGHQVNALKASIT